MAEPTTIILTRHAEKIDIHTDALSAKGQHRANILRQLGRLYKISGVYASRFQRTVSTATPTATANDLLVNTAIDPMDHDGLLQDILEKYRGETVLVVGHSNTVPAFLNNLIGRNEIPMISESDFSNLFIVEIDENDQFKIDHFRYEPEAAGNIHLAANQANPIFF